MPVLLCGQRGGVRVVLIHTDFIPWITESYAYVSVSPPLKISTVQVQQEA